MGFGKDGKGAIIRESVEIVTGSLAAFTGLKQTSGGIRTLLQSPFRIIKTEYVISIEHALSQTIALYLCNDELTASEIEVAIESDGPVDWNQHDEQEVAERYVKMMNIIGADPQDVRDVISKTIRWTFADPEGWCWYVYNTTSQALSNTVSVRVYATHYGVWLR